MSPKVRVRASSLKAKRRVSNGSALIVRHASIPAVDFADKGKVCRKAKTMMASSGISKLCPLTCHTPLTSPSMIESATSAKTEHSKAASHCGCTVPYGIAASGIKARRATKMTLLSTRAACWCVDRPLLGENLGESFSVREPSISERLSPGNEVHILNSRGQNHPGPRTFADIFQECLRINREYRRL